MERGTIHRPVETDVNSMKSKSVKRTRRKPVRALGKCKNNPSKRRAPRSWRRRRLRRFTAKQQDRFTELYKTHTAWSNALVVRRGIADSNPVVNDAMRKAFAIFDARRKTFTGLLKYFLRWEMLTYLRRHYRRLKNTEHLPENYDVVDVGQLTQASLLELCEEVELAMAELSPKDQSLIYSKYFEGLSLDEISNRY